MRLELLLPDLVMECVLREDSALEEVLTRCLAHRELSIQIIAPAVRLHALLARQGIIANQSEMWCQPNFVMRVFSVRMDLILVVR